MRISWLDFRETSGYFFAMKRSFLFLSAKTKTFAVLAGILASAFFLEVFLEKIVTLPLLQDEVRSLGLSYAESLAHEIIALKLYQQKEALDDHVVRYAWARPNLLRIDVFLKNQNQWTWAASNLTQDNVDTSYTPQNTRAPIITLKHDDDLHYWDITYPIMISERGSLQQRLIGLIHCQTSLHLVGRISSAFLKISMIGSLIVFVLLLIVLSSLLKRMLHLEQVQAQMKEKMLLQERLSLLGQLTGIFAHEIGTPLSSLSGHVQLLARDEMNPTKKDRLHIIDSQIQRIEGIVRNYLNSTKDKDGTQEIKVHSLKKVLEKVLSFFGPHFQKVGIQHQLILDDPDLSARFRETELEQVLLNVIKNCIDTLDERQIKHAGAHDGPTRISIKAQKIQETGKIELSITDNGLGMDESILSQITKPFFTTKKPHRGTGLGLSICEELIKRSGGSMQIYSQKDQGTTVTLVLNP